MEPDLDGFRDASVRLRAAMGRDVVFLTPTETVWPEGTAIDPETQEPYDPVIQPLASGWASASATGLVVTPGGNVRHDAVVAAAIGEMVEGEVVVLVAAKDFAAANLDDATRVVLFDGTYDVTETTQDAVGGGLPDRVIFRVKQRSKETTIP